MQATYQSRLTPFYASEQLAFELRLMRGSERISLEGVTIVVEVYTSQLSPRRFAEFTPTDLDAVKAGGVSLKRYSDLFTLKFDPQFNYSLPTGKFQITLHYNIAGVWITNKVVTEKFINDLPGDSNAYLKYYKPDQEEKDLQYRFLKS